MTKIRFIKRGFSQDRLEAIEQVNGIIEEYLEAGFKLTVRQVFYQMVIRFGRSNTRNSYKRLSELITDGRDAGRIHWDSIEDRTRYVRSRGHSASPEDALLAALDAYHRDRWAGQRHRVEVWTEKDALVGIIGDVCDGLDIAYISTRGYSSVTAMWEAALRFRAYRGNGIKPVILHLSDHDPSGLNMGEVIRKRLDDFGLDWVELRRIGLTKAQARYLALPYGTVKGNDTRTKRYIETYGAQTWELDALEPQFIQGLIQDAVGKLTDQELMGEVERQEAEDREVLANVVKNWRAL